MFLILRFISSALILLLIGWGLIVKYTFFLERLAFITLTFTGTGTEFHIVPAVEKCHTGHTLLTIAIFYVFVRVIASIPWLRPHSYWHFIWPDLASTSRAQAGWMTSIGTIGECFICFSYLKSVGFDLHALCFTFCIVSISKYQIPLSPFTAMGCSNFLISVRNTPHRTVFSQSISAL